VETLRHFFDANQTVVYFIYGQVFFVLGLAIALQSRRHSRLELAQSLGWLAAFGFIHGFHEWGDIFMARQIQQWGPDFAVFLKTLHLVTLALSFSCLFQFGASLLKRRWPRLSLLPLVLTLIWTFWFILPGPAHIWLEGDLWYAQASIWARYSLGFPGGMLAAYGLYYQAEQQIVPLNLQHIYRTLRIAGVSIAFYAVMGGLVVTPGPFFPANWLNDANLILLLGIPAPVFRSLTGLVMAVAIIRALDVFDLEVDQIIEQMHVEQSLILERDRIGRELHDGAIQQIYTAGLILQAAQSKIGSDPVAASQRLERAMITLNEAIAALRAYMGELRPAPDNVSLLEGLRQQVSRPDFKTFMRVDLRLDLPAEVTLNPVRTAHLLALVGEALANAARHAQADQVWVTVSDQASYLQLCIEDNGRGFDTGSSDNGYGLRNMRDRARLLGGKFSLDSAPGQGTRIFLQVPWEEN
jgi:signal transduction histidine kinase